MKNNLLFDFTIDKTNQTIVVKRAFDATLSMVWDAFTKPDILDQWWGPEPWKSRTKIMDFNAGGRRLYAMVGPEGEEHWSLQEFTAIDVMKDLQMRCSFTDEQGTINTAFGSSVWDLNFSEEDGATTVHITIKYESVNAMEKMIEMGFKGGFTICLEQLTKLLSVTK